jgi:hypothetical protein
VEAVDGTVPVSSEGTTAAADASPTPTDEAPVGDEAPPPTEETPPPTEETPPPVDEAPPPTEEAPPPIIQPAPPEGSGVPTVGSGHVLVVGLPLIPDAPISPVGAAAVTVDELVSAAQQVDSGDTRQGESNAGNSGARKALRAPPSPFRDTRSAFSVSGGVTGGTSSGFSLGVFAALLVLLLVAPQALGELLALSVAQPRRALLVVHVERPD